MEKINDPKKKNRIAFEQEGGKQRADMALAERMDEHAIAGLKLGRRILKKLQDVEDLIDIIAREIKRQLDRQ